MGPKDMPKMGRRCYLGPLSGAVPGREIAFI